MIAANNLYKIAKDTVNQIIYVFRIDHKGITSKISFTKKPIKVKTFLHDGI